MILPIYTYGQGVLRERADDVHSDSPELQVLIDDMVETMRGAAGIGLAAPQIGTGLRLVVIDLLAMEDLNEVAGVVGDAAGALTLINPEVVLDASSPDVDFEEGCLSIPDVRETVVRPDRLRLRFLDRHLVPHEVEADGTLARVVQHELDHLDGVLFVDHISPLRRRLLKRRLRMMTRGLVEADYPIEPPA